MQPVKSAIEECENAVSLCGDDIDSIMSYKRTLADLYMKSEQYQRCCECCEEVIEYDSEDIDVQILLADAHFELKQFQRARQEYQMVLELVKFSLSGVEQQAKLHSIRVKIAKTCYQLGEQQQALNTVMAVLKENSQHLLALQEYAFCLLHAARNYSSALPVLLKCLFQEKANTRTKRMIVTVISEGGSDLLVDYLHNSTTDSKAHIFAWVALICKEYSAIDQSLQLFQLAVQCKPSCASYVLNLVHVLEIKQQHRTAMELIHSFLNENSQLRVANVTALEIAQIVAPIVTSNGAEADFDRTPLKWIQTDRGFFAQLEGCELSDYPSSDAEYIEFSVEELDLIAIYFAIIKIFYVQGTLGILPKLIHTIEAIRMRNESLHETAIKNEFAYYRMIAQIMTDLSEKLPIRTNDVNPLYICGDSHSLSPAWQQIELNGDKRLIKPVLVTGLKCWHLSKKSHHYPKQNFINALPTVPNGAQVIFIIGEIDCREGITSAVEKCKYENVEMAITAVVDTYLSELDLVQSQYDFEIFVHPVLPLQENSRTTVVQFNDFLEQKITQRNANYVQKQQFKWLGELLGPDVTEKEFVLDGTHVHPRYVTLLERVLQTL